MHHLVDLGVGAAAHAHFLRRTTLLPTVEAERAARRIDAEEEVHIHVQPLLFRIDIGDQREDQLGARRGHLVGHRLGEGKLHGLLHAFGH
jgi:hypothetical protein